MTEMVRAETPASQLTIQEPLAWPRQTAAVARESESSHCCGQCGFQVRGKFCGRCGASVRAPEMPTPLQLSGPLIQVDSVRKEYGDVLAVDDVSFTVGEGEVFGLLGDENSGKSTVLRLLAGRIELTGGSVRILGREVALSTQQEKAPVNLVLDEGLLCEHLSGRVTLLAFARLCRVSATRVHEVLGLVELENVADALVEEYSASLRRRLMIARALLTAPQALCVDAPTRGLDPESAQQICGVLGRLNRQGMALVLSMREVDQATQLCGEVAILRGGRITALERPRNLALRSVS